MQYRHLFPVTLFAAGSLCYCQSWGNFWENSNKERVFSTVASRVYGQFGKFDCSVTDNTGSCASGGALKSANGLNQPNAIAFDATGVYIADKGNNRVLYFPGTSTTATRVYGQLGSFTTGTANNGGITANSLSSPTGVATESGGVYIADQGNNRVLYFAGTSTTASRVYGQFGSFTCGLVNNSGACGGSAFSADALGQPYGVAVDATGIYIAEYNNHRVTYFAGISTTATRVYGQAGSFTGGTPNNGGISENSLLNPYRVSVDSSGVYIADFGNNRVLYYPGTSTTATRVYGQPGFTTAAANNGGISAASLSSPASIGFDEFGVYVADFGNHRALFYPGTSTTATRVYGQSGSFATGTPNNGGLGASSLNQPIWIAADATGVYIMDATNNRGLFY